MLRFSTNMKWWNFGLLTFTLFDSPCWAALVYTVDVFQCIGDTCCCSQEHICLHSSSDTVRTGMGFPVGGLWETTSRTQRCLVLQLHKTRWNRLMENSSRPCLSRNNTLWAFVSNPLWSVRVEAKRLDHMTHTCSVPSGSSSTARYLTRARPSASTWFRNIKMSSSVSTWIPLYFVFNDSWIVYGSFAKWMNFSCSINNEAQSASRMNLPKQNNAVGFWIMPLSLFGPSLKKKNHPVLISVMFLIRALQSQSCTASTLRKVIYIFL